MSDGGQAHQIGDDRLRQREVSALERIARNTAARDALAADLEAAKKKLRERKTALRIAYTDEPLRHTYAGLCPDELEGFDSRDAECPACSQLTCALAPVVEGKPDA